MRRVALTAVAGLVASLGVVSPVHAAGIVISNVKVAWSSAAHTHVRVTWDEVGAAQLDDRVVPGRLGAPLVGDGCGCTEPGRRTGLRLPGQYVGADVGGSHLVGGLDGNRHCPLLRHPAARGHRHRPTDRRTGRQHLHDEVALRTRPGRPEPRRRARPAGPHRYQVFASKPNYVEWSAVSQTGPATTATFTTPDAPPINVGVRDYNEWSGAPAWTSLDIDGGALDSVTIPASTTYGQATVISGWFVRIRTAVRQGGLLVGAVGQQPRTVALQARANAASPWFVVGTVQTDRPGRVRPEPADPGAVRRRGGPGRGPLPGGAAAGAAASGARVGRVRLRQHARSARAAPVAGAVAGPGHRGRRRRQ